MANNDRGRFTIVDLVDNLTSAERELRNRRFFAEADAVKFAKQVLLPFMLNVYEKEKETIIENEGKGEGIVSG